MKLDYKTIQSIALGIEYLEINDNKILFSRFTKQERSCLNYGKDNSFSTAGVRLEFKTNSKILKLAISVKESNPHERNFYSFDVFCNDGMIGQIKNFNKEPQYPYKEYTLADRQKAFKLPDGLKRVGIYFPWSVQGMVRGIELDDNSIIIPMNKKRKIIMYGDSITQGYDAKNPSFSYASRLADALDANVINKGIGGSVFMPELTRYQTVIPPNFITVAYGTNDWRGSDFPDFKYRCCEFYENLINVYPNTPIFAIAPIWRADINEKRKLGKFSVVADMLKDIAKKRKNVFFIDGIDFIPKNKSYYRDGYLHPNDKGFNLYADALIKEINKIRGY